eukprot:3941564-Rhodomonas_salina.6
MECGGRSSGAACERRAKMKSRLRRSRQEEKEEEEKEEEQQVAAGEDAPAHGGDQPPRTQFLLPPPSSFLSPVSLNLGRERAGGDVRRSVRVAGAGGAVGAGDGGGAGGLCARALQALLPHPRRARLTSLPPGPAPALAAPVASAPSPRLLAASRRLLGHRQTKGPARTRSRHPLGTHTRASGPGPCQRHSPDSAARAGSVQAAGCWVEDGRSCAC